MLVSFGVTVHALCAEIVVDPTMLDLPGDRHSGRFTELLILNDDNYALLTGRGVFELDSDFRQFGAYKFKESYASLVEFIHVDDELHVIAQHNKLRIFFWGHK